MDLACPACGHALPAGTLGPAVLNCTACSRSVEVDADGVTSTLPMAAAEVAETIDQGRRKIAAVATVDKADATVDRAGPTLAQFKPRATREESFEATVDHVEQTLSLETARRERQATAARDFGPGSRFGDYDIIAEIARGGMGVVFKARQAKLNRIVALKMILGGQLAHEDHVARFYAEAQAAAHLDHPGIVPVYEVGEVHGQHFFSMGYVEGASLGDRLKDGPLPPRQAADLMHKTARAVAYAHAQGVIHRDLKPSNILLDAGGQPRVTDFGLAKSVADGGEPGKELTVAGSVIGTPSYMPPEQAAGRTADIGALADVYSLGATLYCLLVGRPPFQAASVTETLRQVIEREPVSPRRINAAVDRDLETICLKCLEKEPSRRYKSASELAEDLRRYLDHRPIVARPISSPARLARWCRRNPRVAALAAAFLFVLVGGAAVSTYFAIEATNNAEFYRKEKVRADGETKKATDNAEFFRLEKERADGETQKAVAALGRETEALKKQAAALEETEASIYKYVQTIKNDELLKDARFKPLITVLLAEAADHYQRFVERHQNDRDAASRAKLAAALFEVAAINTFRGTTDAAFTAYAKLVPIQEQLVAEFPGVEQYEADLARSHHNRGNLWHLVNKPVEAMTDYEQAVAVRERLADAHPEDVGFQSDLFATWNNIGNLHYQSSRPVEALKAYEKAIKVQERLALAQPQDVKQQVLLSAGYMNVGTLFYSTNRPQEALDSFQKALAIQRELVRKFPENSEAAQRLGGCLQNLGNLHAAMQRPDEALDAYRQALDIRRRVAAANPTVDEYQNDVAASLNTIGLELQARAQNAEAREHYEQALAISERLALENPQIADYQKDLAGVYVNLSSVKRPSDAAAALADVEKGISILAPIVEANPGNFEARQYLRNAYMGRADIHDAAGRHAQAAEDWQRSLDVDNSADAVTQYSNRRELALAQARAGQHQKAAATVEQLDRVAKHGDQWRNLAKVLALCSAAAGKDETVTADQRAMLAESYAAQAMGNLTRAEQFGIYRDPARVLELVNSPEYAALREREDYRKLVERVSASRAVKS